MSSGQLTHRLLKKEQRNKFTSGFDGSGEGSNSVGTTQTSDHKKKICRLDVNDLYKVSLLSIDESNTDTFTYDKCPNSLPVKNNAFKKWLVKKNAEKREEKEKGKKSSKTPRKKETKCTPQEREEHFRAWLKTKSTEAELKKAEALRKTDLEEKEKKQKIEKGITYLQWVRMKERFFKEKKRLEEEDAMRTEKELEDKRLRRQRSEHAYQQWLHRNRPRLRATNHNQGDLSRKGSTASITDNSAPWPSDVESIDNEMEPKFKFFIDLKPRK